ncbi:LIC_10190 family membrane protein [Corallibacter sp.]|uniref:LIC_10190 family membrane protein n=1 Tax=Corallibacter sp. TaxID=2038084 RepID=UPI003A94D7E9
MLLILLSWIYIIILASIAGISLNKYLGITKTDDLTTIFHGFFSITIFASIWAIFSGLNAIFCIVLSLSTAFLFYLNRKECLSYFLRFKEDIVKLDSFFKLILIGVSILILAQSASVPTLPDNESYYIQTILWLNEFGFVKGLTNLHLFLGQTSGWHILQSAFSFSFIYSNFNDISGLCLLLGNVFAIIALQKFIKSHNRDKTLLYIGLLPVFNCFLFPFISSPSPDLAVIILLAIVVFKFITNYKACSKDELLLVVILTAFLIFIKVTAIVCLIFPFVLFIKHHKANKKHSIIIGSIYTTVLLLMITKNIIITGNALYPLFDFDTFKTSWSLPKNISSYFSSYGNAYGYGISTTVYETSSVVELLKYWINYTGIDGFINKCLVVLLLVFAFFLKHKTFRIIYGVTIIQLVLLFYTSPQFRFYLPFFIVLVLLVLSRVFWKKSVIKFMLICSILLCFGFVFIPSLPGKTKTSSFHLKNIIEPYSNSKYPLEYKTITTNNATLNIPVGIDFFWGTGNTPIPALNEQQLDYFKTYYNVLPEQKSSNLKDGYILKSTKQ